MNYQEMTDFEINQLVGRISGEAKSSEPILSLVIRSNGRKYDPCNSWADAGPIAEENEIGLVKVLNGWCATNDYSTHEGVFFVGPNPRRAICIAFLMMKGGE